MRPITFELVIGCLIVDYSRPSFELFEFRCYRRDTVATAVAGDFLAQD